MKLIFCPECKDLVQLREGAVRTCTCGSYGGKYLNDHLTAVVNEGALLVGLDNNTFVSAVKNAIYGKEKWEHRVDFFFTGWIPTKPGEVIFVASLEVVEFFDDDYKAGNEYSTMPVSKGEIDV